MPPVNYELFIIPEHLIPSPVLMRFMMLNHSFSVQCFVDHWLSYCEFSFQYGIACPFNCDL